MAEAKKSCGPEAKYEFDELGSYRFALVLPSRNPFHYIQNTHKRDTSSNHD
jgi:hypothetical protein